MSILVENEWKCEQGMSVNAMNCYCLLILQLTVSKEMQNIEMFSIKKETRLLVYRSSDSQHYLSVRYARNNIQD